jgi:hypothetical protein
MIESPNGGERGSPVPFQEEGGPGGEALPGTESEGLPGPLSGSRAPKSLISEGGGTRSSIEEDLRNQLTLRDEEIAILRDR